MGVCRLPSIFTIGSYKVFFWSNENIPAKELNELVEIIQAQYFLICAEWKNHFKTDDISFYC